MALEWKETYGNHTAQVGAGLFIKLEYTKDGYRVIACGKELKLLSEGIEDGKRRGVELAKRELKAMLAKLD